MSAGWSQVGAQRRQARLSQGRGDPKASCGSTGHRLTNPSGRGGVRPRSHSPVPQAWAARSFRRPALHTPQEPPTPARTPSQLLCRSSVKNRSKFQPSPQRYWGHHSSASDPVCAHSAQRRATFRNPAKASRAVTPASCDVITPFSDPSIASSAESLTDGPTTLKLSDTVGHFCLPLGRFYLNLSRYLTEDYASPGAM